MTSQVARMLRRSSARAVFMPTRKERSLLRGEQDEKPTGVEVADRQRMSKPAPAAFGGHPERPASAHLSDHVGHGLPAHRISTESNRTAVECASDQRVEYLFEGLAVRRRAAGAGPYQIPSELVA
jgi:hypothetical protein